MSGYVDDPRVREDLHAHDVEFLPKPFTTDQLVGKVLTAMARQREQEAKVS